MAYHLLAYAELESGNGESALELLERGRELFGAELGGAEEEARSSCSRRARSCSLARVSDAARAAAAGL